MKIIPLLDLTAPGVVVGRHAAWFPDLCLKLPFQWATKITKYKHQELSAFPNEELPHELATLRALAAEGMAPPIGDLVYVETLVSEHPGGWHADPTGAWAYEMADANTLPPGRFDLARMKAMPIGGSVGAWNDTAKPGNVVNGYLVDVRRSAWDALHWHGASLPYVPRPGEDTYDFLRIQVDRLRTNDALRATVHALCQFPPRERDLAYQDFILAGKVERGERRVAERATLLGFRPSPGESVVEIGCQAGGFLQLAWVEMGGEGTVLGIESNPEYVACARRLAGSSGHNICIREMNAIADREAMLAWIAQRCPRGIAHLLLCSMEKHLTEAAMFALVDAIGAEHTYIETNACALDSGNGPVPAGPMKLLDPVTRRGGVHVGDSRDRNLRRLYRIDRAPATAAAMAG